MSHFRGFYCSRQMEIQGAQRATILAIPPVGNHNADGRSVNSPGCRNLCSNLDFSSSCSHLRSPKTVAVWSSRPLQGKHSHPQDDGRVEQDLLNCLPESKVLRSWSSNLTQFLTQVFYTHATKFHTTSTNQYHGSSYV